MEEGRGEKIWSYFGGCNRIRKNERNLKMWLMAKDEVKQQLKRLTPLS